MRTKQQYLNVKTQEICHKILEDSDAIIFKYEGSSGLYTLPSGEFYKQFAPILKG